MPEPKPDVAELAVHFQIPPTASLALLLREPCRVTSAQVRRAARTVHGADAARRLRVAGRPPVVRLELPDGVIMVHSAEQPYFPDKDELATDVGDANLRNALVDHQAWVILDLLQSPLHIAGRPGRNGGSGATAPDRPAGQAFATDRERGPFRYVAALTHVLLQIHPDLEKHTLALIVPQAGVVVPYDTTMLPALGSEDPLRAIMLCDQPDFLLDPDDPELLAAEAEARRRFGEFETAFRKNAGDKFAIKAPIRGTEYTEELWVDVAGLDETWVWGTLETQAILSEDISIGDQVRVRKQDILDWAIVDRQIGSAVRGCFTAKVARRRAEQQGRTGT